MDVSDACETCHIPWWLTAGSCLVRVRNGATIPWDDDLDVCHKKEDERRFISDVGSALHSIDSKLTLRCCAVDFCGHLIKVVRKPSCYPWIDDFFKSLEPNNEWTPRGSEMVDGQPRRGKLFNELTEAIPDDKFFPLTHLLNKTVATQRKYASSNRKYSSVDTVKSIKKQKDARVRLC